MVVGTLLGARSLLFLLQRNRRYCIQYGYALFPCLVVVVFFVFISDLLFFSCFFLDVRTDTQSGGFYSGLYQETTLKARKSGTSVLCSPKGTS